MFSEESKILYEKIEELHYKIINYYVNNYTVNNNGEITKDFTNNDLEFIINSKTIEENNLEKIFFYLTIKKYDDAFENKNNIISIIFSDTIYNYKKTLKTKKILLLEDINIKDKNKILKYFSKKYSDINFYYISRIKEKYSYNIRQLFYLIFKKKDIEKKEYGPAGIRTPDLQLRRLSPYPD